VLGPGHAWPGGDGKRGLSGVGGPERHADCSDLVFGLMDEATELFEDLRQFVRSGGRRRDRIHGAHLESGRDGAERECRVPVHRHFRDICRDSLDFEAFFQVCDSVLITSGCELHGRLDHLAGLLLEDAANHILEQIHVLVVEGAQNAHRKHVLALFCILDVAERFLLQRDLDDGRPPRTECVEHLTVREPILFDVMSGPLIVDQHENVVGKTSSFEAREQGDLASRGKADAVTARASDRVWRGPDLGGYDLHGPKAVACFGAELGKGNGCFLGTFASVADDFDDVLRETDETGTAHKVFLAGLEDFLMTSKNSGASCRERL